MTERIDVHVYREVAMKKLLSGCAAGALALALSSVAVAFNHPPRSVGQLISTFDSGDCVIFTLNGITEADPRVPSTPWFAIPRTQFGAKDAYAMLLSARLTGEAVEVRTSNDIVCGYIRVSHVIMPAP